MSATLPPVDVCTELLARKMPRPNVELDRYAMLSPDGRRLIESWLRRARQSEDCWLHGDCFEAYVYAFISFNGWAECVTDTEADRGWLNGLMLSAELHERFNNLLKRTELSFADDVEGLYTLLPIFKVQELRTLGVLGRPYDRDERPTRVRAYIDGGAKEYQPKCWLRHFNDGEPLPTDWAHTVSALYRVRCNLFHGTKSPDVRMDRLIVTTACRVLTGFLADSGLIGTRDTVHISR